MSSARAVILKMSDGWNRYRNRPPAHTMISHARAARQRIDELVQRRIALADAHVRRRDSDATDTSGATTSTGTDLDGKLAMDAIRAEFETLGSAQREHIAARDADAARLQARTAALIVALTAGGCAMMIGAVWLLSDERRRRDRAEDSLRRCGHRCSTTSVSRRPCRTSRNG